MKRKAKTQSENFSPRGRYTLYQTEILADPQGEPGVVPDCLEMVGGFAAADSGQRIISKCDSQAPGKDVDRGTSGGRGPGKSAETGPGAQEGGGG